MRVSFGRSNLSTANAMKSGQEASGAPCRGKEFERSGHEPLDQITEPASRRCVVAARKDTTHEIQTHYIMI